MHRNNDFENMTVALHINSTNRTISITFHNVCSPIHDSQMIDWGYIYHELESVCEATGKKFTVGSPFGKCGCNFN